MNQQAALLVLEDLARANNLCREAIVIYGGVPVLLQVRQLSTKNSFVLRVETLTRVRGQAVRTKCGEHSDDYDTRGSTSVTAKETPPPPLYSTVHQPRHREL